MTLYVSYITEKKKRKKNLNHLYLLKARDSEISKPKWKIPLKRGQINLTRYREKPTAKAHTNTQYSADD